MVGVISGRSLSEWPAADRDGDREFGTAVAKVFCCFVVWYLHISADIIFKADMPYATCLDSDSPRFSGPRNAFGVGRNLQDGSIRCDTADCLKSLDAIAAAAAFGEIR